jgi:hypothetical protein
MSNGNRGHAVTAKRRGLRPYNPSMMVPGKGDVKRTGDSTVFGGERSAKVFADAMSPIGGPAKG